jgi:hypothetical protein
VDALGLAQRAVHLDDLARACSPVQPVDVLRDHCTDPALLLEFGQSAVPVVGLGLGEHVTSSRRA